MHRLHQDPVDPLAQLDHVGRGDPALAAPRHREHVFIQRAPEDGEEGGNNVRGQQSLQQSVFFSQDISLTF